MAQGAQRPPPLRGRFGILRDDIVCHRKGFNMKSFEPFAEWAAKNGVRRSTGYELIRTGQLDHVRLGKRIMVASDALERLFERQKLERESKPDPAREQLTA